MLEKEYFYCALATFFCASVIGVTPLFRKNKTTALKTFCFFFLCVSLWTLFLSLLVAAKSQKSSTLLATDMHYPVIWIPIFFFHSIDSLFEFKNKIAIFIYYCGGVLFTLINLLGLLVGMSIPKLGFKFMLQPGPMYIPFLGFFFLILAHSYYLLIKAFINSSGQKRNQIKIMFGAIILGHLGGVTNFLPVFSIWIYPLNPYFTLLIIVYVAGLAYAIMTFKLFDFDLLVRWGLAYSLVFIILIAPILISIWLLSYLHFSRNLIILTIAFFCSFAFDPLRKRITKFVNRFIFHSPDFQILISGIDELIRNSKNIYDLSEKLAFNLNKIWNTDHSGIAIWDFNASCFQFFPEKEFSNQIIRKLGLPVLKSDFLIRTLETERRLFKEGVILEDEITGHGNRSSSGERTTFWKMRRTMRWIGAAVCVPIIWERDLLGFLILGKKSNNASYNDEDKKFLSHVAEKITVAVKNLITNETSAYNT